MSIPVPPVPSFPPAELTLTSIHGLKAAGVKADGRVLFGPIADTLLSAAEARGVDWMVVGTHARKGLLRVVLGSVAEEVIRRANVPVLTVRNRWHEGCAGRSCATCSVEHTDLEQALTAEVDG